MKFLNALEQAKWHILSLYVVIVFLTIISVGLMFGWHASQSSLTIHYPPEIPASGLTMKASAYPKSEVFSFAFYVWQSMNHWQKNGAKDYAANIKQFAPYLTPHFSNYLEKDFKTRFYQDELQDRLRIMQGMNGAAFNPENVMYLGHGTWLVHLTMRLTERMDSNDKPIKDAAIDYTLRVVKYSVDANTNKWGLALDGFAADPKRVKTFV